MKIYTRTGDNGTTSLPGGTRTTKTDERIEFYGVMDELNSYLGLLSSLMSEGPDKDFIAEIQIQLFRIGSIFAGTSTAETVTTSDIARLESEIDRIQSSLPPLHSFIIPGGTPSAATCHVCRAISRRAERRMLSMAEKYTIDSAVPAYMNRLSDYLFVLARNLNFISHTAEKTFTISCK